jgi:hypothetical protein
MSRVIYRLPRLVLASMLLAAVVGSETRAAGLQENMNDGWHAWRVASSNPQAIRCCYSWSVGRPTLKTCDLDRHNGMSIVAGEASQDSDETQIYAYFRSGKATRITALSSQCPVRSAENINDLGLVDAGESVLWLNAYVSGDDKLSEDALAAIAAHDGGLSALIDVVENRRLPMELREQSLFWMAQSDDDEAFDYVERLLVN